MVKSALQNLLDYGHVAKHKFVCLMHSEAKEYQKYQFGTEEGLLQGPARRWEAHALKTLNSPKVFSKALF